MTDVGKFTEPKIKMVPLLPWEAWPSEFEVQKNDSLALIIKILYLTLFKPGFFWLSMTGGGGGVDSTPSRKQCYS